MKLIKYILRLLTLIPAMALYSWLVILCVISFNIQWVASPIEFITSWLGDEDWC